MTHWTKKPKPPRVSYLKHVRQPLAGATVMSLVLTAGYPPLGLNLLSDCLMLGFGLFIVETALAKGRAEVQKPAREAMINDLLRMRGQVDRILFLMLRETANADDLPTLRAAAERDGDVAEILARRRLTTSPAPMRTLGILNGSQLTWQQVIWSGLSPRALRLETLIARYMTVADAQMLAALQQFESTIFTEVIEGRLVFDDNIMLEIFWRSMIQCLAGLDDELSLAMVREERGSLRPAQYVDLAMTSMENEQRAAQA